MKETVRASNTTTWHLACRWIFFHFQRIIVIKTDISVYKTSEHNNIARSDKQLKLGLSSAIKSPSDTCARHATSGISFCGCFRWEILAILRLQRNAVCLFITVVGWILFQPQHYSLQNKTYSIERPKRFVWQHFYTKRLSKFSKKALNFNSFSLGSIWWYDRWGSLVIAAIKLGSIPAIFSDPDFHHRWGSLRVFVKLTTSFYTVIIEDSCRNAAMLSDC